MNSSTTTNSNTNFPPYHLLSRFHQHLNHLNDMAFTHTKILQEIIEKRSNEPILSSPNGSMSSSPSSSASTIDSIQQRKRSYPSNDHQDMKNENHLNKRPRKQSKPQQLLKIGNSKSISNGQSSTEDEEDEEEEEMGEITQPIEKNNSLPIPPPSILPYPPFLNYIQDLARTNPSASMNHFLETLALESRRLAPTFSLPPLFTPTIPQQQNPYLSQLLLNNSFLNHFPTPSSTINRFIPPTHTNLKDHPTFPFHFSTPKKRRTKVTDTRLSPRIASKMPVDDFSDDDNASSPHSSDDHPSKALDYHAFQISLTPLHLRKAKLMFFYTRYPSSAVLKNYFPDVRFDKLITAQLVKWFSNFREFFYQQIEKYARQCLAEGIRNVDELVITSNSELYRVLNVHYNRSNQINVPISFSTATQAALREFFLAILQQKDLESSWKKSIYKVMQRLDDQIPEFFKNDHWMHSI